MSDLSKDAQELMLLLQHYLWEPQPENHEDRQKLLLGMMTPEFRVQYHKSYNTNKTAIDNRRFSAAEERNKIAQERNEKAFLERQKMSTIREQRRIEYAQLTSRSQECTQK